MISVYAPSNLSHPNQVVLSLPCQLLCTGEVASTSLTMICSFIFCFLDGGAFVDNNDDKDDAIILALDRDNDSAGDSDVNHLLLWLALLILVVVLDTIAVGRYTDTMDRCRFDILE